MKRTLELITSGWFAIAVLSGVAFAQKSEKSTPKKIYQAAYINPHAPVIDGKLDDPAWEKAEWQGDFIQREPYEGEKPSQATMFRILYDDKNLYVAIRANDAEPD